MDTYLLGKLDDRFRCLKANRENNQVIVLGNLLSLVADIV